MHNNIKRIKLIGNRQKQCEMGREGETIIKFLYIGLFCGREESIRAFMYTHVYTILLIYRLSVVELYRLVERSGVRRR